MASTEQSPGPRFGKERPSIHLVIWLMAATYLAAHVPFLPQTPYDIDGVNFTLALHEYDLAKHQPHPPGSPLFVGLGRLARTTMGWAIDEDAQAAGARALDAAALAVWSACFGALAAFGLFRLYVGLGQPGSRAALATAATLATPLFWFSGVRPMSDLPGLAVGALALGFIAPSLLGRASHTQAVYSGRLSARAALVLGCFFAGLAPGMRVQMAWLTWPATAAAIALSIRRERWGFALLGSWVLGFMAWLLPLCLLAGGPTEYVRLLRLQAAEDVASGQMLALNLTLRQTAQALQDSLIAPWGEAWLGWFALTAAAIGALRLLVTRPRMLATLVLVFAPYAALHLGFQDTSYVRYALPLVPVVALLTAEGLAVLGTRVGTGATLTLAAVSLTVAVSAVVSQSRQPAPAYRALDEVRQRITTMGSDRPVLGMHHAVGLALRGEPMIARVLPAPPRYEWLELAKYWRTGGVAPVWFLASRRRTDLALIDPQSRSLVRSYRYPAESGALLAGSRPRSVDWVEIQPPGWVALEGWSLTPEVRGVSVRAAMSSRAPMARALLRRRSDEVAVLLGGRNLGGPCATGAVVTVSIDGHAVLRFSTRAGESFVRLWRLPSGTLDGNGPFAQLEVTAEDRSGSGQQVDVAFEQFDLQGPRHSIAGLSEGWFEPEYEPREGVGFRWMSDRATIHVDAFGQDVALRLRGETPRRYFGQPSVLVVRVGETVLATWRIEEDFDLETTVPAALLQSTAGRIDIEASQAFVPDERSGNGDRRALALRVLGVEVRAPETLVSHADLR